MLASLIVGRSSRHDLESQDTHEISVSIEVSIGFVLRHLRNEPRPGVRANEEDGMRKWDVERKSAWRQRGLREVCNVKK
jgi:hypothetical protein